MSAQWFICMTGPNCESRARLYLAQQRFTVSWLKCRERIVRPTGRVVEAIVSLFPRYLFVRLDPDHDQWHEILRTPGVVGMIMRDDKPAPLPDRVARDLFARADCTGLVDLGGPKGKRRPSYKAGSRVRVTDGPFTGFYADFRQLDGASRAQVLVEMMGGKFPVWLDESQIESAA